MDENSLQHVIVPLSLSTELPLHSNLLTKFHISLVRLNYCLLSVHLNQPTQITGSLIPC